MSTGKSSVSSVQVALWLAQLGVALLFAYVVGAEVGRRGQQRVQHRLRAEHTALVMALEKLGWAVRLHWGDEGLEINVTAVDKLAADSAAQRFGQDHGTVRVPKEHLH